MITFGEHRKAIGDGDLRRIVERVRAEQPARPPIPMMPTADNTSNTWGTDTASDRDMIPLRDVIPSRTVPYVTVTIIVLNALAWVSSCRCRQRRLNGSSRSYGVVPADFSAPHALTSMFLHGGWFAHHRQHVVLWIFGDNVEDRFGHGRFLVFYLLCGMAAALRPDRDGFHLHLPTIGASGAIAGVMGAYFVLYPRSRVLDAHSVLPFLRVVRAPGDLPARLLVPDAAGQRGRHRGHGEHDGGGVAFMAHVAGFLFGIVGVFVFKNRKFDAEYWG